MVKEDGGEEKEDSQTVEPFEAEQVQSEPVINQPLSVIEPGLLMEE